MERDVRVVRGRGGAARLGERDGRQVFGRDARRPEGAAEGAGQHDLQARAHRSSGRPTGRTTPSKPTCGRTPRRRQMADIGITAQRYSLVLYGNSEELKLEPWTPEIQRIGHGAVRLEGRHLVSPEAARREPAGRQGAERAARCGRPARRSPRSGRSTRRIRSATGRARLDSSPTPSSARTSTTSS